MVAQREQCPTECTYGRFSATIRLCSRSAATTAGLASNRSRPWNGPGAVTTPRSSSTVSERQVVPPADLEVVGVVRRGHLDRTGAERRVDVVVGDDRDPPAGQRQLDLGADQVLVALVVRVHGDRGVAEHRLGPGGRDDDRGVTLAVPDRDQLAVVVGVLDLDVRQRGQAARAPVDDPLGPVDQAVVEHPLEDGLHGAGQALVHREPLAGPVDAVAEPAHLAEDLAAGLGLPLPDPLDEGLPAEVVPGQALLGQLPLHHVLGGDAGVVHARQPERVVALHAPAPGQRVHQRVLERVAEVQRAGDVGRRDDDAERRLAGVLRPAGREVAPVDPPLVERAFYLRGNELARQVGAGPRPGWVVGGLCHGHAGDGTDPEQGDANRYPQP